MNWVAFIICGTIPFIILLIQYAIMTRHKSYNDFMVRKEHSKSEFKKKRDEMFKS